MAQRAMLRSERDSLECCQRTAQVVDGFTVLYAGQGADRFPEFSLGHSFTGGPLIHELAIALPESPGNRHLARSGHASSLDELTEAPQPSRPAGESGCLLPLAEGAILRRDGLCPFHAQHLVLDGGAFEESLHDPFQLGDTPGQVRRLTALTRYGSALCHGQVLHRTGPVD